MYELDEYGNLYRIIVDKDIINKYIIQKIKNLERFHRLVC